MRLTLLYESHHSKRVNAPGRAVANDLGPLLVGAGRLVAIDREAEVVLAAAEVAEAAAVENHEVDRRGVVVAGRFAPSELGRYFVDDAAVSRGPADFDLVRQGIGDALPGAGLRRFGPSAVEDVEAGTGSWDGLVPPVRSVLPARCALLAFCAASAITAFVSTPSADSSHAPTTSKLLPAWRPNVADVGSLIATAAPSQAFCGGTAGWSFALLQHFAQLRIVGRIGRLIAFEDNRVCGRRADCPLAALLFAPQSAASSRSAATLGEPHDLERMIAGQQAVLIVVNRLARAG